MPKVVGISAELSAAELARPWPPITPKASAQSVERSAVRGQVAEVTGLYVDLRDYPLWIDGNSQLQFIDRTQSSRPIQ